MGFPGGSGVKNLPAVQETQVQSLGREDLLEKEMSTHSNSLAWEIPWTEEPGGLQSTGFPRQECWSGLPFPPPRNLSDPGLRTWVSYFTTEPPGKPKDQTVIPSIGRWILNH